MKRWVFLDYINKAFIEVAVALIFSMGGILSGRVFAVSSYFFVEQPWIIALYPSILSVRGDVSGILSGKLGTMLHTGRIRPKFINNTDDFYSLLKAIFMVTFIDAISMGNLTFIISFLVGYTSLNDYPYFLIIPATTCTMATAFSMPLTIFTAFSSFRRGLDPDIIVYPIVAVLNDFLVSSSYVMVIMFTLHLGSYSLNLLACLLSTILLLLLTLSKKNFTSHVYTSTLREATPTVF
ncbi:MAG: magnesium transporter, partial [archaeon GB-1867-035]|nr:magnesium transporter [Candidatus Culexmicrobium profundum]